MKIALLITFFILSVIPIKSNGFLQKVTKTIEKEGIHEKISVGLDKVMMKRDQNEFFLPPVMVQPRHPVSKRNS